MQCSPFIRALSLVPLAALSTLLAFAPLPGGGTGAPCREPQPAAAAQSTTAEATGASATAPATAPAPTTAPAQIIELAICLDTSGSMNGLIDSARARIWDIVSDLATATPTPKLRVALVTFGNDGHVAENGWTLVDSALSDDLDTLSAKLFALTTNGGTEYVGRAVDVATKSLSWTPGDQALKLIVIAGNESAEQDQTVKYQEACQRAIAAGIMVNSIYCGGATDQLAEAWRDVARLADGKSACIDQNTGVVAMDTPFDAELVALGTALNSTYIPYGAQGEWGKGNQVEQDGNAQRSSTAVAAQRSAAKGSMLYCNTHWDLVDASRAPDFKLESIETKDLPEAMRVLTIEGRREYIAQRAAERAEIQAKVLEASTRRAQFIATETAKLGAANKTFDRAIRDAVRAQAVARGLAFPAEPMAAATAAGG
jgi:hypothetical protein